MNKVSPFPTLAAPCPLIYLFFSNLSNTDEVALSTNIGKTFLSKETASSNIASFPIFY